MIKNPRFALVFRACAFLFTALGLLKQIGVFSGTASLASFMFYTIQSNVLALVYFAILIVNGARHRGSISSGGYSRFSFIVAVDLLVTMFVFWALLAPSGLGLSLLTFENLAVHAITPLLCLADFLMFSEPGRIKYRDVYYVCVFPLAYAAAAIIAGFSGFVYRYEGVVGTAAGSAVELVPVRFPYFFLDFDQLGAAVILYVIGMLLFFLLLGHIIYFLDRRRVR